MNSSEQIATINRKRADEHRRVDMQHDQLIQQVRDRCVHERLEVDANHIWFGLVTYTYDECKHCGQPMPGSE